MLRIATIIKNFVMTGGAERHAVEVTRRLARKGHGIDLFCRFADPGLVDGIRVRKIPQRWTSSSVLNSLAFALDTAKALEGEGYDIVHSNERGFSQDILTLHCFSYKGSEMDSGFLRRLNRLYLSPRSMLYLWLEARQMESPCLVAVSELIREDVLKNYGACSRVKVITPGVDTCYFHPERIRPLREDARSSLGIGETDLALLFVGSEFKRKGLEAILRLLAPPMKLIVVGKGDRMRYHRSLIEGLGIAGMVHLVGLCTDVRPFLAASDILILPSTSDAFGMSVLEAMACGLPAVTSRRAGVSMLVEDGVNGFTYGDLGELRAILETLRDAGRRMQLGINARKTAERHSWDRTADEYERLFLAEAGLKRRRPAEKGR
jgi:UDP-glucose:(heptosyl)LPS alpha-1,3-glucosyltransferase